MKRNVKKKISSFAIIFAMVVTMLVPNLSPFTYTVSAYEYLSRGIDVSHHNGSINWNSVSNSGIGFAIIRAGSTAVDGEILYKDRKFYTNYSGATDAGIKVGAYYYCGAYTKEGFENNAYDFLKIIDGKSFDLPVYIDLEQASKQRSLGKDTLTNYVLSALDIISDAGYNAGIYANRDWFKNYLDESRIRESGYHIWWAQYPSGSYAVDPTDYDKSSLCGIWQYSSRGRINGISGKVDVDVAYIDYNLNTKLSAPKLNVSTDGQIATMSWNKINAATHYDLRLYYADGRSLYDHWGGDPNETELQFKMDPGDYKVQVCSADDNGNFVYCDLVYFTIESEPLVAPVLNVSVDGQIATFSWNKVASATHYDLRLYYMDDTSLYNHWGGDPNETELKFKVDPGTYKAQVCSADDNGNFVYCNIVYFTIDSANNSNKSFEDFSSASVSEGTYYFSPKCAPNSCIDSEGGETLYEGYNHNIHLWKYLGNSNQQFKIIYAGEKDGKTLYYIQNTLTKQYVSARGENVTELPYKISIAKWYFLDCGNGYYKIINYFNDLALDIQGASSENGTNAWCYDPTDMSNSAQLFTLNCVD